ncbi:uncharacterized protein FRV6_15442 [Fusarium oxysporum]|uniref:Zn(2)-C6 fungal-type domain-containing protein n=1 Tax=Fusarium oxysporum TaxID=5507 RepID=A0A2H3TRR6_FUSOX|nr:uncharacterized protein FRV6_15442 [Fusarium oxysporum]
MEEISVSEQTVSSPHRDQGAFILHTLSNSARPNGRIRVTRACDRCKKRKVRCNGQQPCNVCAEARASCSFNATHTRGRRPNVRVSRPGLPPQIAPNLATRRASLNDPSSQTALEDLDQPVPGGDSLITTEPASRMSPEPTQTDLQGYYVGSSSGISFLSRIQKRFGETVSFPHGLSVFNFGDAPLPGGEAYHNSAGNAQPCLDPAFFFLLERQSTTRLVQRYFDFAVPVDRFLHRPTIERRLDEFYETKGAMYDKDTAPAERSVLFMVFAIAQEHMVTKLSQSGVDTSVRYFRAADHQLSMELGAVRLASVQARLCQCLWLLSQSRINHCWSLFGTVARLALALGLHRSRNARSDSMSRVEIECRRRTFWSAYSLDNYLSAALGRPRTFHDRDIDQKLPSCVDDDDIDNADESISSPSRPLLTFSSAPVAYAKLSRILGGILVDVYSIEPMTVTQRLTHTAKYMQELKSWRSQMSNFLDQDPAIAAQLILIYQRQRNVLNLAYWHTVILTNRPLLLSNFARLTSSRRQVEDERKAQLDESAADCLNAAMNIVGIVDMLVQSKQLFRAFWFTPYFAFSACVILYVYTIQRSREQQVVYQAYFEAAERCQQQIVDIAGEGTLTSRYCLVLEELRAEVVAQRGLAQNLTQVQSSIDARTHVNVSRAHDAETMAEAGLSMDVPDLSGMGSLDDWHVSPSDSLEDITGWGQFDAMVVSGFNGEYPFIMGDFT